MIKNFFKSLKIRKFFKSLQEKRVIQITWNFKGGERISIYSNKKTYIYYKKRYRNIATEIEYKIVRIKLNSEQKKDIREIGEVWI